MPQPLVSVVVPTHDRPDLLQSLLDGLGEQSVLGGDFEVIVVDDGSTDPVVATDDRLDLKVLRHERPRGPAAARNTGWRAAVAPLIAFTDDDCRPAPEWIESLLRTWAENSSRIVQGRTEPDDPTALRPLSRSMLIEGPSGFFETCNIAYPCALLEKVGGFDESFERACGEDVDLGLRAMKYGVELVYEPNAVVTHVVHQPSLPAMLRHARIWSDAVRVLGLHPQLRSALLAGVFWKPTHPLLLGAVGGLALALSQRQRRVAAVAILPYAAFYSRVYRRHGEAPGRALVKLPVHVLVDGAELLTLARGSVAHRTLML